WLALDRSGLKTGGAYERADHVQRAVAMMIQIRPRVDHTRRAGRPLRRRAASHVESGIPLTRAPGAHSCAQARYGAAYPCAPLRPTQSAASTPTRPAKTQNGGLEPLDLG